MTLKKSLDKAGITISELATLAGLNTNDIERWIDDEDSCPTEIREKLIAILQDIIKKKAKNFSR